MSNSLHPKVLPPVDLGRLFVVSAPAGTGKTTLVEMLAEEFPNIMESISCTTRQPREGERDGEHYHFLAKEEFRQRIAAEEFIEHVELFGDYYGTSLKQLHQQRQHHHVLLTIDTQGALQLRRREDVVLVFLLPPSLDELKRRLTGRNTESDQALKRRLEQAEEEIKQAAHYDYHVVNDDLEVAYQVLRSIVVAEAHKPSTATK